MDRCEKYRKMAKFLGVEMNQPFYVRAATGYIYGCPYRITDRGIYDRGGNVAQLSQLGAMFSGTTDITPCPDKWEPMHIGETFCYIDIDGKIKQMDWTYSCKHIGIFGNVFRDRNEAKKYRDKIKAMLNNRK